MAARLAALSDYPVDAEFDCGCGECGGGSLHPHTYARGTQRADPAGRRWVMVKYHQRYVQLDARVDMRVRGGRPESGIGADEVHTERARSQGAQSFYHYRQAVCRIRRCSQHTQSAGIGDRRGEPLMRDESHTRSDEWMPDAILPGQPGLKSRDIRQRARCALMAVVDSPISGRLGHGFPSVTQIPLRSSDTRNATTTRGR